MVSSVGHSCSRSASAADLLTRYMSYKPAAVCPADAALAGELISKGCEPLPRRRCLSRKPKLRGLLPFPQSLWPNGLDRQMWVKARGKNDFLLDDVLALGGGGIRIGFDIGGEPGNFAARMAERNVTVVTSTIDAAGELVAAHGLFLLLLSPAQRFPFYDSVLDLVHTTRGLDEGGFPGQGQARPEALGFLKFDIDRVLRAGGLLWVDNYLCADD